MLVYSAYSIVIKINGPCHSCMSVVINYTLKKLFSFSYLKKETILSHYWTK